jgi:Transcriptional regulator
MKKPLYPRKLPSQDRSKFTVTAIIEAATHIFATHGYGKMTTNAVAELAGVSIGSLYQYFPNKEALICTVYKQHRRKIQEAIAQEMNKPLNISDFSSILHLVEAIAKAHLVAPELHAKFENLKRERPFSEILQEKGLNDIERRLEQLLSENKDIYAIEDETLSAKILVSAVYSLIHLYAGHETDFRKISGEIARMLFGYINADKVV